MGPADQNIMKGDAGEVSSCACLIGADGEAGADARAMEQPRKQGAGHIIWHHTYEDI